MKQIETKGIKNLCNEFGQLSTNKLRRELGLNPGKLPVGAKPGKLVGDTFVYLLSRNTAKVLNPGVTRPHRLIAICNECRQHVPAGKFQQHRKVHSAKVPGSPFVPDTDAENEQKPDYDTREREGREERLDNGDYTAEDEMIASAPPLAEGFTKVVNGKKVPDDYCDSCGKTAASVECGHGVLCEKCAAEIHGSVEAACEVTQ
jgi:hypothetical protein